MKFYGKKLKEFKKAKKITSIKLAEMLGVNRKTIYSWETDRTKPTFSEIKLICEILNISISQISDIKANPVRSDILKIAEERKQKENLGDLQKIVNLNMLPEKYTKSILNLYDNVIQLSKDNERLKNRNKRYESILENIDPIVYVKAPDHTYKYVNDSFVAITGTEFTKEDIIGITHRPLFDRGDYIELLNLEKKVFATGEKIVNARAVIPNTNDNQIGLINIIPRFTRGKKRELFEILVTIKDITEISKAMERQSYLNQAINSLNDMVFIRYKDDIPRFIYLSDSCYKIYGYTSDELIENPKLWDEIVFEEDRDKLFNYFNEESVSSEPEIFRIINKNGKLKWVQRQLFEQNDRFGNSIIFGTIRDITGTYLKQKDREELNRAVDISNTVVWVADLNLQRQKSGSLQLTYISDNIYRLLGIRKEAILNDSTQWLKAVYPEDYDKAFEFHNDKNYPKQMDFRMITLKGEVKWINLKVDKKDNLIYGVIRDFTELRTGEQERMELQEAINNSDSLIIVERLNINENGKLYSYVYIGNKIMKLWGISKAELKKKHNLWIECIVEEDRKRVIESYNSNKSLIYNEYRVKVDTGKIKWLSHKSLKKEDSIYSYINDITDLKENKNYTLKD